MQTGAFAGEKTQSLPLARLGDEQGHKRIAGRRDLAVCWTTLDPSSSAATGAANLACARSRRQRTRHGPRNRTAQRQPNAGKMGGAPGNPPGKRRLDAGTTRARTPKACGTDCETTTRRGPSARSQPTQKRMARPRPRHVRKRGHHRVERLLRRLWQTAGGGKNRHVNDMPRKRRVRSKKHTGEPTG